MFRKKFLAMIMSLIMIVVMTTQTYCAFDGSGRAAVENPSVDPQWQHAITMSVILDLSGDKIQVGATVAGRSGTSYKNGVAILTKTSGSNMGVVQTWNNLSSAGPVFQFSGTSVAPTPGTYRLTFAITTVRNGVTETITGYKDSTK